MRLLISTIGLTTVIFPIYPTNSAGGVKITGAQSNYTSPTAVCVLFAIISLSERFFTFFIDS